MIALLVALCFGTSPPLTVWISDRPLAVKSAVAVKKGPGSWELTLANGPLRCEAVTEGVISLPAGGRALRMGLRELLTPKGQRQWQLAWLWTAQGRAEPKLPLPPPKIRPGETFAVPLKVATQGPPAVRLHGLLTATICAPKKSRPITDRPQSAQLVLQGQAMPIRGAAWYPDKHRLRLSTAPVDCQGGAPARAWLALRLAPDSTGPGQRVESVYLDGSLLAKWASARRPSLTIRRTKDSFELSGETRLGGTKLSLQGKIAPVICHRPPAGSPK